MRADKTLIKPNNPEYKAYKKICQLSATVFNQALYYKRQAFFRGESLNFGNLDALFKIHHKPLYDSLPNAGSQAIIKELCGDFDDFWKALDAWKKAPEKFKTKPQIPGYKKPGQLKTFLMASKPIPVRQNVAFLPKKLGINPVIGRILPNKKSDANCDVFKQVRIVPHGSCFWLEIVYQEPTIDNSKLKKEVKLNPNNKMGIDIGINVLMAVTTNQAEFTPVLINGKPIKSINQYFNKVKAKLTSEGKRSKIDKLSIKRYNQIQDYFHKCSNKVLALCLENDIGEVVIGKNCGWKQSINIGKKNNQSFVSIPHARLIEMLEYKLAAYGIAVIVQEESYTSKADALAGDKIPTYDKENKQNHQFSGRRKHRGLYLSAIGKLIHADINAALNILRKYVTDDSFLVEIIGSGRVFRPTYWTPCRPARGKSLAIDCLSICDSGDNIKAPSIAA